MRHAFSPRLDNALLSHGAGKENNTKEWKRQKKKGEKVKVVRKIASYALRNDPSLIRSPAEKQVSTHRGQAGNKSAGQATPDSAGG